MTIPETSLIVQQGGLAQFEGSVQEMAQKLEDMKAKIALVNQFFKDIMDKDIDFGIIPGTPKPSLYQPGADKLCALYNLAKTIVDKNENKNFETGHYDVTVRVRLIHRGSNIVAGELEGSCSTMESKYRYRWVSERDIPKGIDKDSLVFKEYDGQYGPYKKYRIENDDLYSQWNTVLKMAIKRAYVGATLCATGLSGIFSQEEDELDAWIDGEEPPPNGKPKGNGQQQRQQSQRQNHGQRQGNANPGNRASNQRVATEKQIGAIFTIIKRQHNLTDQDAKDIVSSKTGKEIDQLSSAEASTLIDYLGKVETAELLALIDIGGGEQNFDDIHDNLFQDEGGR